jgi:hypothetical protein
VQLSPSGGSLSPGRRVTGIRFRAQQIAGKLRRYFRVSVYTAKNEELLSLRQGECTRCGACCKILFQCPFLVEEPANEAGTAYTCSIYGKHFKNCRIFPIVPRDLLDVEEECGYTFVEPNARLQ